MQIINKETLASMLHENSFEYKTSTKSGCESIVDAVVMEIVKCLKNGGEVRLAPLGKLSVKTTKERKGRNPKTGENLIIKARKRVKFSMGEAMNSLLK